MSPRPPPKVSLRHDHDWTRGKFHWVLQLINRQTVKLFDSLEEKFNTKRSPNQPNQNQNQSVMDQGNLMSVTAQQHTVKEQHAPEENRDIASFNTNKELNRAINEEDMDFNIPGLPHSTVKQLHSASVRELMQKIENHPNRHVLQRDQRQSHQLIPSVQNQKK